MSNSQETPLDGEIVREDNKLWECGHPYKHPLPTPAEEPWTQILKPLQKKDEARCKAWKEEVQNILIFAGLFSAVVTAFIIELQKTLQKDPIEVILPLLLAKLGDVQLSQAPNVSSSFPERANVRINTLWFLSLVLCLATVLVGTVSLQWLREYERPRGNVEPQTAFSLHRMQAESLNKWWVPQIFSMLPLLLQVALVLFLMGLSEHLFNLNRSVAVWVALAIGLTLLFLVATTVLPTFQALLLFLPWRFGKEPRSPCPYKSPQAWAFHHLVSLFVKPIMAAFKTQFDKYLKVDSENLTSKNGRADWKEPMPRATRILFRNKRVDTWLEHCVAWLFQRDLDYMKLDAQEDGVDRTLSQRPIPLYDAAQGILEVKHAAFSHTDFAPVDHCIASVVSANDMGVDNSYARFLHRLSLTQPLSFGLPPGASPEDHEVLQEDATLRLFSRDITFKSFPPEAIRRCVEICIRLTAWMYSGQEARPCHITDQESINQTAQCLPIQWVAYTLEKNPLDLEYTQAIRQQTRLIVLSFFDRAKTWRYTPNHLGKTFDTNKYLGHFLSSAAKILTRGGDYDVCDDILDRIPTNPANRDYAYQAAYIFCHTILADEHEEVTSPVLQELITTLYEYQASLADSSIWDLRVH
ncbi:hypothetical protein EST38_g7924 [Candolleomyces aberdarensis]|uniref:DUF6535 domain-containing protein n=1 Tax=Candolleomyces aberdarensis TaxID=2316362 RepID=A0A4V1Q3A8_9AGAR|nr:hypothetical protein EST38_g7924 [Candolleomyces aberdarensis]